jgi:hypothetical protein
VLAWLDGMWCLQGYACSLDAMAWDKPAFPSFLHPHPLVTKLSFCMLCMRDNRSTGLHLLLWALPDAHSSFTPTPIFPPHQAEAAAKTSGSCRIHPYHGSEDS